MKHCNIYIATTAKGVRQTKACGMYLIEGFVDGKPYTVHEFMDFECISGNKATLILLKAALMRMTEKAGIQIYTKCDHVYCAINNNWNIVWEKKGWVTAKGKVVKNAEEWQQVTDLLGKHVYTVTNQHHSYETWMQGELEKRLGGKGNV